MKKLGTISPEDLRLMLVTDSIGEAVQFIRENSITRYGLTWKRKRSPIKWLFEKG